MDRETWCDAIAFTRNWDDGHVSIGGGEPTLHPEFFDILDYALHEFDYVWLATNGSRTAIMKRLYNIIMGDDPEIHQDDRLTVALSRDCYHDYDKVDPWVLDTWKRMVKPGRPGFELRDISGNAIAAGRAKRTGVYSRENTAENCVCSDLFITPAGDIKLCGCSDSPVIGHVSTGVSDAWQRLIMSHKRYNDFHCHKAIKLKRR